MTVTKRHLKGPISGRPMRKSLHIRNVKPEHKQGATVIEENESYIEYSNGLVVRLGK